MNTLTIEQRTSVRLLAVMIGEIAKIARENAVIIRQGIEPIRLAANDLPDSPEKRKLLKVWAGLDAIATAMEEVEPCA